MSVADDYNVFKVGTHTGRRKPGPIIPGYMEPIMAKSVVTKSHILDGNKVPVGIKFAVTGFPSFEIHDKDLNALIRATAVWHGIGQKVGDAAAKDAGTPVKEKYEALIKMRDQIVGVDGQWSVRGEGGDDGLVIRAVARATGTTDEQATAAWAEWDEDTRKAMKSDGDVVKAMAKIRAEDAERRAKAAPEEVKKTAADALAKLRAMTAPTDKAKKAA